MSQKRLTLNQLVDRDAFVPRHIGPREDQVSDMLLKLKAPSLDGLVNRCVPDAIRMEGSLNLAAAKSEHETLSYLREMASRNEVFTSMIGMGYYGTYMPPVILRRVFENPGWYTAYTPYQAEASQGRLEALLNFQQVVMDLTGFNLANASLLDEATAAAEAMTMIRRLSKSKASGFFVDEDTHPQTIDVIKTRAAALGVEIITGDPFEDLVPNRVFGVLVSYPGSSGEVRDFSEVTARLTEADILTVAATDLLALTMLKPPADWGADVAIGSAQRFGVPMGYGGPHSAFFATRDIYKRNIPGRIIGVSVDSEGHRALRMALQTREQHIRRDKATSNICTAQALLAIIAGFYAVYHGPKGLGRIATRIHRLTSILAEGLRRLELEVVTEGFFDTITVRVPGQAASVHARALERRINLRSVDADHVGISLDETTSPAEVETVWRCFSSKSRDVLSSENIDGEVVDKIPGSLVRSTPYLTHPIFSYYHSETELLRYMRKLQSMDIALDRSMIPLGSCTMKLNAASEMIPLSWPEFAHMHPFAPLNQAQGYQQLFEELEEMLCEVTGFDAVSLQPNAGSQGEYAGLVAIRRFHDANGNRKRTVCLIPNSAHGTNPASAVMAGFNVIAVASDENGNVDVDDLKVKAEENAAELGAFMITYPSTHGVFEERIKEICGVVHDNGGQVYIDGANLNALVGIARLSDIGGDVCHMNLHKTFCIPHGGGGPGVGPIGVKTHLAPFLPGHSVVQGVNPAAKGAGNEGAVSAAPWGSAMVLPISWAYITMMGGDGLTRATQVAILNANYVAHRLKGHYPIVYTGASGDVAHECIIDLRQIDEETGIGVEDVAKRLVDYGYHAPTMSWPVPNTLMIEPTESEDKEELDRFCDAMISIRAEIADVESGRVSVEDSVTRRAPHTAHELSESWDRPYSMDQAFFPLDFVKADKYWPVVGRIDNVAGDRTLQCACPPMSDYVEAAE